jgi:hypothetical protein
MITNIIHPVQFRTRLAPVITQSRHAYECVVSFKSTLIASSSDAASVRSLAAGQLITTAKAVMGESK